MLEKQTFFALTTLAVLPWSGLPAWSGENLTFAAEVDSCVASVNAHLDLESAQRVRHVISKSQRTGIGYAMTIETSVISDDRERKFESYCVVNGANPPLKFRIDSLDT